MLSLSLSPSLIILKEKRKNLIFYKVGILKRMQIQALKNQVILCSTKLRRKTLQYKKTVLDLGTK